MVRLIFSQGLTVTGKGNVMAADRKIIASSVWLVLIFFIFFQGCFSSSPEKEESLSSQSCCQETRKKVLLVNSYHRGNGWTDGIVDGALQVFGAVMDENGEIDESRSRVAVRAVYMDTKRNSSEEFIKESVRQARAVIGVWQPDIVIAADDNASRYLIEPYFKNSEIPVVFCGINMDASIYGFPCRNITGMVEMPLVNQLLKTLSLYARGERIGYLGMDSFSSRKDAERYEQKRGVKLHVVTYVKTFAQWQMGFRDLQEKVDMLIVGSISGMEDWNESEARQWARSFTVIPTGTNSSHLRNIALVSYA
ncbi:MAG: hypothetical protein KJ717_13755, partial [Proteobacteria bacterium]|nr:hypothetical protein [Pseudomonadota bacterium]